VERLCGCCCGHRYGLCKLVVYRCCDIEDGTNVLVKLSEDLESKEVVNAGGRLPHIRSLFQARAVVEPSNGKIELDTYHNAPAFRIMSIGLRNNISNVSKIRRSSQFSTENNPFQQLAVTTPFPIPDPINVACLIQLISLGGSFENYAWHSAFCQKCDGISKFCCGRRRSNTDRFRHAD
jgi:hypothetical protein